jgi:hypothetical protein
MSKEQNGLPLEKAQQAAIKSLTSKKVDASEAAKPFLDKEMLIGLIDIASQSKFDDSPLVMKQKIRKLIKSRIRKEDQ